MRSRATIPSGQSAIIVQANFIWIDRLPNSGLRVEKGREQMFQGSNPKRNVHLVLLARCDIPSSL